MATTTTNFGWDIPQSTDLVKDGATAIAALGQDIDTALVDLKGGTTGQVLAKASGTDLDFTWIAVDPLTILDAKGDLISATAADTPARLAVGTNGQVLTADSTTATGLKWADSSGGGMTLISTTTLSGASTTVTVPTGYINIVAFIYGLTNNTSNGFAKCDPNNLDYQTALNAIGGTSGGSKTYTTAVDSTIYLNYTNAALRTDNNNTYTLTIMDYLNTSNRKSFTLESLFTNGSSVLTVESQQGVIRTTSTISSLVFTNPGGTWSAGTVKLYGVK